MTVMNEIKYDPAMLVKKYGQNRVYRARKEVQALLCLPMILLSMPEGNISKPRRFFVEEQLSPQTSIQLPPNCKLAKYLKGDTKHDFES